MQIQYHCLVNCFTQIIFNVLELHKVSYEKRWEILRDCSEMLYQKPLDYHVALAISEVYLLLRERLDINDPLEKMKREQNAQALELLPMVEEITARQADSLLGALKMSSVGNMIDFAVGNSFDVLPALKNYIDQDFALSDYRLFQEKLSRSGTIAIVCDNAGEIVFDKFLVDEIIAWRRRNGCAPARIHAIVKGEPILNDAMRADASMVKFDEVADITDTGSGYLGFFSDIVSEKALKIMAEADLILSKGIANYETICLEKEFTDRTFYLFKSKCKPISLRIGVPHNSIVFAGGARFAQ